MENASPAGTCRDSNPPLAPAGRTDAEWAAELERVRALNAALDECVHDQARQLAAARAELDAFTDAIGHDLRAPARGIAAFTRVLLDEHAAGLDGEARRLLGIVDEEARRMHLLIDGVLAFANAGRQPLDVSGIDVAELAADAFRQLTEGSEPRVPRLTIGALPSAEGDRRLIRRVLTQLLENAIKFTRRTAAPEIAITGRSEDGWSVYCVADNGVGFNPRFAGKLFGMFQRLHSCEEFEGAGAGLATVQRIVRRHGGKTWAEGAVNGGARFHFSLPAAAGGAS